jgi:hypothetical protein
MHMHTVMHAASHRISNSGPHMRPCGRILKQWFYEAATDVNLLVTYNLDGIMCTGCGLQLYIIPGCHLHLRKIIR